MLVDIVHVIPQSSAKNFSALESTITKQCIWANVPLPLTGSDKRNKCSELSAKLILSLTRIAGTLCANCSSDDNVQQVLFQF